MKGATTALDRAVELALTSGLLAAAFMLLAGLLAGRVAWLRAGVLVLLFTPVARVLIVTVGLALRRDWLFVVISLWILGVLLSSLRVAGFF